MVSRHRHCLLRRTSTVTIFWDRIWWRNSSDILGFMDVVFVRTSVDPQLRFDVTLVFFWIFGGSIAIWQFCVRVILWIHPKQGPCFVAEKACRRCLGCLLVFRGRWLRNSSIWIKDPASRMVINYIKLYHLVKIQVNYCISNYRW